MGNKLKRGTHIRCDYLRCGCQEHTENSTFMHFNNDRKVFWYEIPRNASSTVKKNLLGNQEYREHQCTPESGQRWARKNNFRQFAIVRNPFTRLLSMLSVFERLPNRLEAVFLTKTRMSYDTFVSRLKFHYDHHCEPQTVFLPNDLSDVTLIRLENFEKDWNDFFSGQVIQDGQPTALALPPSTRRWGGPASDNPSGRLHLLSKKETYEMIVELYKNDFKALEYSKDLKC